MTALNRRRFLGTSAATLGAAALPAFAASPNPCEIPTSWDETFEVIVIGSGFAGLAAAVSAAETGAKVAVLEKMAFVGGNSSLSGGMIAVPGSSVQKAQGIDDKPENLMDDMERIGLGLGDPEHVEVLCREASDTFEWTRKSLGVVWNETLTGKGGHSASRCMITKEGTGIGIIKPALAKLKTLGVVPRTKTFVEKIVRDPASGRVVGVVVREDYVFGKPDSGTRKTLAATKGVVLAYGGFGADVAYRKRLDPKLGAAFLTTNQPGATAELWRESSRIGANIIQADWIQCLPNCSPKETGMGIATHFASISASLYGLWVSSLTSSRFVNEFGDRKVCTDAILTVINKGGTALAVADAEGVVPLEKLRPGLLAKTLKEGSVRRFETLDELAAAYKMVPAKLRETVENYNQLLASGSDTAFGRPFDKGAKPLGKAPWYVSEMSPKVHHAMGGVATSVDTAVLDVSTDEPIPGLWAAGECVGGIHGAVRIGACAVLDCLVNGRKAGKMAARG